MKVIFINILLLFGTISYAQSDTSLEIVKILNDSLLTKSLDMYLDVFEKSNPDIKKEFWETKRIELKKEIDSELYSKMAKIYDENLSDQELDEVLSFYKSTAGKKFYSQGYDTDKIMKQWFKDYMFNVREEINAEKKEMESNNPYKVNFNKDK